MAYLYRHIRLDNQEIFYIGIGSDNKGKYTRAFTKKSRNKYWHNIANLGYEVEIILDDLTWEEACEKEKEFIKLYGRKDLNEGTLVNMTDGGDGLIGIVITEETRLKHKQKTGDKNGFYGHTHPSKGKTYEEYYGIELANKLKQQKLGANNPSSKIKGKNNIEIYGKEKAEKMRLNQIKKQSGINHPMYGKPRSEETKNKMRIKVVCPYCNKVGGLNGMKTHHFENCKYKKNEGII